MNFEKTMTLEKVKSLASDLQVFWSNDDLSTVEFFSTSELELHLYKNGFASELSRLNMSDPVSDERLKELTDHIKVQLEHRKTLKSQYDISLIVAALENEPAFAKSKDTIYETWMLLERFAVMVNLDEISLRDLHALIRHYELAVPVDAFFQWLGALEKKVSSTKWAKNEANAHIEHGLVISAIQCLTSGDANEHDADVLYAIGVNADKTFTTPCGTERLTFDDNAGWTNQDYEKWEMNEYCLPYNETHATTDLVEV
ncbi:hypothetical protein [Vibrio splendidus]|uniref:hypothetical protein n=1 Tax=Vibrio splendidus TaxID=29497 RepID=UPI003D123661